MKKIKKTYDKAILLFIEFLKWFIPTAICMLSVIALIESFEMGYTIELRILCIFTCSCMPILFSKWSNRMNEIEGLK